MSGHDFGLRYRCNTDVRPGFFWGMLFKKAFMDQMVEAFMKVKEKMPTHYFNDSFCASRVSGMAKKNCGYKSDSYIVSSLCNVTKS